MNPTNPKELARLRSALEYSRRQLQPFREHRYEAIRQYVGAHYSSDGAPDKVPMNLLELAVSIYARQLAARTPRALVTTRNRSLKPMAARLELAINHQAGEMRLGATLRRVVLDALFSIGILKTGLADEGEGSGGLFVDPVGLDDWVHDIHARRYEEATYAGNRYRAPLSSVVESDRYDRKAREKLASAGSREGGGADDRASEISQGQGAAVGSGGRGEYEDHVELWDLWLPREKLVVTLPARGQWDQPLRVVEWDGPEAGPYRLLSYHDVPDNLMPLPPAALWMDLHDLANRLFRKLGRQAERQKTVLGVRRGGEGDGRRVVDANDGEALAMDDPKNAQEYRFGGIDQPSLAFTIQVKDLFSYLGGNLDTLGGLAPMTDTVGQEELLARGSSKRVADMADRTTDFAARVLEDLAHYLWRDPLADMTLPRAAPGMGGRVEVPERFSAETLEGDLSDYDIRIEPYSMEHESPAARLATLEKVWQTYIAPNAAAMAQQGIVPDFAGLMKLVGRYADMDELKDLLIFTRPPSDERGQAGGEAGGAASEGQPAGGGVTERRYTRANVPTGGTRAGRDHTLMQTLLGAGTQPKMNEAMDRGPA